jgi:hypothetical protein
MYDPSVDIAAILQTKTEVSMERTKQHSTCNHSDYSQIAKHGENGILGQYLPRRILQLASRCGGCDTVLETYYEDITP